ncbi:MAG TPA: hypothetical protein V6D17_11725 [Candidatus Obscuribacterales bacterium]
MVTVFALLGIASTLGARGEDWQRRSVGGINYRIQLYTIAIKKNPKDALAFVNRGIAEIQLDRLQSGIDDINKGLALNPKLATVWLYDSRQRAHLNLGHFDLALRDATLAIALDPKRAWRYKERAQLYRALKKNDLARKDFDHAIALDPKQFWCYMERARFHESLNEYSKAIADYTKAIQLAAHNPVPYRLRADLYHKLGKEELAKKDRAAALLMDEL